MPGQQTRRRLLRAAGTGLAAFGTVGVAGCLGSLPGYGDDDAVAVEEWLADPAATMIVSDRFELLEDELTERRFHLQVPSVVREHEDVLSYDVLRGERVRNRFGVPAIEVDWQLTHRLEWDFVLVEDGSDAELEETTDPTVEVVAGSFDPDAIHDNLTDWSGDSPSPLGSVEGFDLYETGEYRWAIRDDFLVEVVGEPWNDPTAVLETTLQTRAVETEDGRWAGDDDAGALLAERGAGQLVGGGTFDPGRPEGRQIGDFRWKDGFRGVVRALDVDGRTTTLTDAFCYESESSADVDALRSYVDANRDVDDPFATLEEFSIDDRGRVLVLSGSARTEAIVGADLV